MTFLSLLDRWQAHLPAPLTHAVQRLYEAATRVHPRDPLVPLTSWQRIAGFAGFVAARFYRARGLQAAGSLTFTTLFALVPLLTLALTVLTAFAGFRQQLLKLRELLMSQLLPDAASRIIGLYVTQFSSNAAQLRLVGTATLVLAAAMAMLTVDRVFSDIWRVRTRRPLATRLAILFALLVFGPLLIGIALTLSTTLFKAWLGAAHSMHWIPRVLLTLLPWLTLTTVFAAVYAWLPNRHVPATHAVCGGAAAALAFELMRWLLSFYVHHFHAYTLIYGTFAAFPIFLMWIYLAWAVTLGGAVLTASLSYWNGEAWRVTRDHPDQRFRDALQVLRTLMGQGELRLALPALHARVQLGYEDLEIVLEPLLTAGLVEQTHDLWRASARAWLASVGDVWVLFHRGPLSGGQWSGDVELSEVSTVLDALPTRMLGLPLARLVAGYEAAQTGTNSNSKSSTW